MRKFGKYEKMRKNAILQTYITSLLCLVLCVTMFFGTSLAWFSDSVEVVENEVYVGTLEIELKHTTFRGGQQQKTNEEMTDVTEPGYQVFASGENNGTVNGIRWEPGYTAVEKFEVTEKGDLAFSYQMGIGCMFEDTTETTGGNTKVVSKEAKEAIARAIDVWSYEGKDAKTITELRDNFEDLTKTGWTKVGTLYEVIKEERPVFKGEMNMEAVTATKVEDGNTVQDPAKTYHLIALHMDENFDGVVRDAGGNPVNDAEGKPLTVLGDTLNNITIKLIATQKHSEQDAFANTYDAAANKFAVVATAEELKTALENGESVLLGDDIDMEGKRVDIPATGAPIVIDLNGHTLTSKDGGGGDTMAIYVNRGAKLILSDTAGNGKVVSSCYGVYVMPGASFIMNGGTIDVSGNGVYDFGVIVWNGEFVLNTGAVNGRYGVWASNYWKNQGEDLPVCEIVIADNGAEVNGSQYDMDITDAPDTILDIPNDPNLTVNRPETT